MTDEQTEVVSDALVQDRALNWWWVVQEINEEDTLGGGGRLGAIMYIRGFNTNGSFTANHSV